MNNFVFKLFIIATAAIFAIYFSFTVVPEFLKNPDLIAALSAGFDNPYSSGYSADVIACWLILFFWVLYEYPKVKYGWVALVLGFLPGVAVGFAVYLILRMNKFDKN